MNFINHSDRSAARRAALPQRWVICSTCQGNGKHSLHLGAFTQEDIDRDWSGDEWDGYLSGGYDRQCEDCGGRGSVRETFAVTPAQVRRLARLDAVAAIRGRWARESRAESEAERRMGA